MTVPGWIAFGLPAIIVPGLTADLSSAVLNSAGFVIAISKSSGSTSANGRLKLNFSWTFWWLISFPCPNWLWDLRLQLLKHLQSWSSRLVLQTTDFGLTGLDWIDGKSRFNFKSEFGSNADLEYRLFLLLFRCFFDFDEREVSWEADTAISTSFFFQISVLTPRHPIQ